MSEVSHDVDKQMEDTTLIYVPPHWIARTLLLISDIEKYPFPDSTDEGRFVGLRDLAEQVQTDGRAFVRECWRWDSGCEGLIISSATW